MKVLEKGNFNYSEFLVSKDHPGEASKMVLTQYEKEIIHLQVESLEQPLRNRFGRAKILSGKRSEELNTLVGGSKTSDHLTCNATDVVYLDVPDQMEVFKYCIHMGLPYRQLIYYKDSGFIHKSINIPGKDFKHEALIYSSGEFRRWV